MILEYAGIFSLGIIFARWWYRKEIAHYWKSIAHLKHLAALQAAYRPSNGALSGILGAGAGLYEEAKPKGGNEAERRFLEVKK